VFLGGAQNSHGGLEFRGVPTVSRFGDPPACRGQLQYLHPPVSRAPMFALMRPLSSNLHFVDALELGRAGLI